MTGLSLARRLPMIWQGIRQVMKVTMCDWLWFMQIKSLLQPVVMSFG